MYIQSVVQDGKNFVLSVFPLRALLNLSEI